jgi:hypothetical protein
MPTDSMSHPYLPGSGRINFDISFFKNRGERYYVRLHAGFYNLINAPYLAVINSTSDTANPRFGRGGRHK